MMILCFVCAFALGICVCLAFYIFVILPCIKENDKEFIDMLNQISILENRLKQDYETINFQRKQLRQLQNVYNKLLNKYLKNNKLLNKYLKNNKNSVDK